MSASASTIPASASAPAAPASEHIPARRIFAFLAMVFGMFMAILDIQIVSASLSEIQAASRHPPTRFPGCRRPT
jgi:DHA2 family multidrug resistance protein